MPEGKLEKDSCAWIERQSLIEGHYKMYSEQSILQLQSLYRMMKKDSMFKYLVDFVIKEKISKQLAKPTKKP